MTPSRLDLSVWEWVEQARDHHTVSPEIAAPWSLGPVELRGSRVFTRSRISYHPSASPRLRTLTYYDFRLVRGVLHARSDDRHDPADHRPLQQQLENEDRPGVPSVAVVRGEDPMRGVTALEACRRYGFRQ